MIISSYTHFLADNMTLFFFVAEENYIVYMHCIFSIHSSAFGHLGWSNIVYYCYLKLLFWFSGDFDF